MNPEKLKQVEKQIKEHSKLLMANELIVTSDMIIISTLNTSCFTHLEMREIIGLVNQHELNISIHAINDKLIITLS